MSELSFILNKLFENQLSDEFILQQYKSGMRAVSKSVAQEILQHFQSRQPLPSQGSASLAGILHTDKYNGYRVWIIENPGKNVASFPYALKLEPVRKM